MAHNDSFDSTNDDDDEEEDGVFVGATPEKNNERVDNNAHEATIRRVWPVIKKPESTATRADDNASIDANRRW